MNTSTMFWIVVNILSLVTGCALGYYMAVLEYRRKVDDVKHPHLGVNKNKVIGGIFMALALFVIVQNTVVNNRVSESAKAQAAYVEHQAQCNEEFLRVLGENAQINAEDRELEKRDDALRDERDAHLTNLVKGLLAVPPGSQGQVRTLLENYDAEIAENDRQRAVLAQEREELQKRRDANPYPSPRCE